MFSNNSLFLMFVIFLHNTGCDSKFSSSIEKVSSKAEVISAGKLGSEEFDKDGIPVDSNISIKLSSIPVAASINDDTLFVTKDAKVTALSLTANEFDANVCNHDKRLGLGINLSGVDITLDPVANLECATTYYVCLTKEIKFADSLDFEGKTFSFTTAACSGSSFVFNNGATAVNSPRVNITLNTKGATEYVLTNSKDCSGILDWKKISGANESISWDLSGIDATAPTPGNTVNVYAKFRDSSGIETPCYKGSIVYDNVKPMMSSFSITASSAGTLAPMIGLTLTEPANVALYDNVDCSSPSLYSAANVIGASTMKVSVAAGVRTSIYAKAVDAATNSSNCTFVGYYIPKSTEAAAPIIADPNKSFNHEFTTTLKQSSPADPDFKEFRYSIDGSIPSCSSGIVAADNSAVNIPEVTTLLQVVACDLAGNKSGLGSVTYTYDDIAPNISNFSVTTSSPGTTLTPSLTFALSEPAIVTLFSNASCTGTTIYSSAELQAGNNIITTNTLTVDSDTAIYLKAVDAATNTSSCTLIGTYRNESALIISSASVTTTSPGVSLTPSVVFTLNRDANVTLYSNQNCSTAISGSLAKTAGANTMATTSLSANVTTSIYAKAVSNSNISSNCILIGNYTNDTAAPTISAASVTTSSPGSTLTPSVAFTLSEDGNVTLYSNANCSAAISNAATKTSGANTMTTSQLGVNTTVSIYMIAIDALANTSSCTAVGSYTNGAPQPAISSASVTTVSPGSSLTPTVALTLNVSATVTLYSNSLCSFAISGSVAKSDGATTMTTSSLNANATTSIYAKAVDSNSSASSCTSIGSYTNDSTAPTISSPSVVTSSPGTSLAPTVTLSLNEDASVTLYRDTNCTSAISWLTSRPSGTSTMVTDDVNPNTETTIYMKATDSAGNTSACTFIGSYYNDTSSPSVGTGINLSPASTNISISWGSASDLGPNGGTLKYKVVYGSSENSINTISSADGSSLIAMDWTDSVTSASASGLSPSTSYAFAVLVKDAVGNKALYTPVSATTLAADSTIPTVSSAAISTTPGMTSMTLSWTAASDNRDSSSLLQYRVYQGVSTSVLTASAIATSLTADDGDVTPVSDWMTATTAYTITGLTPNTQYYFNIVVQDTSGNANNYTAASPTTSADNSTPVPGTALSAKGGITSVYLSWGVGSDNASPASTLSYKVIKASATSEIDTLGELTSSMIVANYSKGMTSFNVSGLTAGVTYAFTVVVRDQAGNEAIYSPVSVTTVLTDDAPPDPGTDIVAIESSASVDLSWGDATDNVSPASGILYRVMQDGTPVTDWTLGMTSVTIPDLEQGRTYSFTVEIKDGFGNLGQNYNDLNVTTLSDINEPTIASSVITASPGPTTIDLTWNAATDDLSLAAKLQYKVVQDLATSGIDSVEDADISSLSQTSSHFIVVDWTPNLTSISVGDLVKNTTYAFAVIVRDEAGNKALYTPIQTTTTNPSDGTAPVPNAAVPITAASLDSSGIPAITVTWVSATDNVTTANNLKYQLVMSTVESNIDSVSKALAATIVKSWFSTSSSSISGVASNLESGTTYAFSILVKDQAGNIALYPPISETTDLSGAGVISLSSLPAGETTSSVTLKTLNGLNAGFYFQRAGETQRYYYQYVAGKTRAGGTKYTQYLLKFSSAGVLQTTFGSSGWANFYNATNLPNDSASAVFHWQECNSKLYSLVYNNSSSFKLFEATLTASTVTFSSSLGTVNFSTANLKNMSCVNNKVYIIGDSTNGPQVYSLDTSNNSLVSGSAIAAGTTYLAPFVDGSSNLWVFDWNLGVPAGYFSRLDSNLAYVSGSQASLGIGNFPLTSFPTNGGDVRNGFFGGSQASTSDTLLYTGVGNKIRIWNSSAASLLSNFTAGSVTPTVSYMSSSVSKLSSGTMLDGRQCKSTNKFAGYDFYKFYSSTQSSSNKSFYGYHFYMTNTDGSRSSFFNRSKEVSFRNKNYKGSNGAGKKLISVSCDSSSSSSAFAFKSSKNYVTIVLMALDSNVP